MKVYPLPCIKISSKSHQNMHWCVPHSIGLYIVDPDPHFCFVLLSLWTTFHVYQMEKMLIKSKSCWLWSEMTSRYTLLQRMGLQSDFAILHSQSEPWLDLEDMKSISKDIRVWFCTLQSKICDAELKSISNSMHFGTTAYYAGLIKSWSNKLSWHNL